MNETENLTGLNLAMFSPMNEPLAYLNEDCRLDGGSCRRHRPGRWRTREGLGGVIYHTKNSQ
jgi:hypothetical protein